MKDIKNFKDFKNNPLLICIGIIILIVLIVVGIFAISPASPQKLYQKGIDSYMNGEYESAFYFFQKAANQSYADAQYQLGLMYNQGVGVEKNVNQAKSFFELATKQNHAESAYQLGLLYENSQDETPNYEEARHWYEKAANNDHLEAQYKLATLYLQDPNKKIDYVKVRQLLEKAVVQNHVKATYQLGVLYQKGLGGMQDYAKAKQLFEDAVKKGDIESLYQLGQMYENGWGVQQDYAKAKQYYEKAVNKGNTEALYLLGELYAKGLGVQQDYSQARTLLEKSANHGNIKASFLLAEMYKNGNGVQKNLETAKSLYEKVALKNDVNAQYLLGTIYENDYQDYKKAYEWYKKASDNGSADAQCSIALLYFYGKGVKQDYKKAKDWLDLSASKEHAKSQYILGCMYYDGIGVKRDKLLSIQWYEKSANQGYDKAQASAGFLYMADSDIQDYTKSEQWLSKAFEQNNLSACYWLGRLYLEYYYDNHNSMFIKKAIKFYEKSANQGYIFAQSELGHLYWRGELVEQNYEKARVWYEKVVTQDESITKEISKNEMAYWKYREIEYKIELERINNLKGLSAFRLGDIYAQGKGIEKNQKLAHEWYEKATNNYNNMDAQYELGKIYEKGIDVKKNIKKAIEWYEKAGNQGNEKAKFATYRLKKFEDLKEKSEKKDAQAQYQLALIYFIGTLAENDGEKAFELFLKAAKKNHAGAQYYLGYFYEFQKKYDQAIEWYEKAIQQNYKVALYQLGRLYLLGDEKIQNYTKARKLFEKAIIQGYQNYEFIDLYNLLNKLRNIKNYKQLQKLVSENNVEAQCLLAYHYVYLKQMDEARNLAEKAANRGNVEAQCLLGINENLENDDKKRVLWLQKASKQGHLYAQCFYYDIQNDNKEKSKNIFSELENSEAINNVTFASTLSSIYLSIFYSSQQLNESVDNKFTNLQIFKDFENIFVNKGQQYLLKAQKLCEQIIKQDYDSIQPNELQYIALANYILGASFHIFNRCIKLNIDYDKAREYYWKSIEYGNKIVLENDTLSLLQSSIEAKKEEERNKVREEREKQDK